MEQDSIIFAPLEGLTNYNYREFILENYPEWSYLYTDFYRVPPTSKVSTKNILKHFGNHIYDNADYNKKTVLQLLANESSNLEGALEAISDLGLEWIDFNAGCPSKKVNAHKGGSWLLSDLDVFRNILMRLRKSHKGFLSLKIRSGYKNSESFSEILNIVEGEGIDLLTVHPRTKIQMYEGHSDWDFIKKAVERLKIPVVGNGDVNTLDDFKQMKSLNVSGVMIGRGAIARPDFAKQIMTGASPVKGDLHLKLYLKKLEDKDLSDSVILKSLKSLTVYICKEETRRIKLLRSSSLSEYKSELLEYS